MCVLDNILKFWDGDDWTPFWTYQVSVCQVNVCQVNQCQVNVCQAKCIVCVCQVNSQWYMSEWVVSCTMRWKLVLPHSHVNWVMNTKGWRGRHQCHECGALWLAPNSSVKCACLQWVLGCSWETLLEILCHPLIDKLTWELGHLVQHVKLMALGSCLLAQEPQRMLGWCHWKHFWYSCRVQAICRGLGKPLVCSCQFFSCHVVELWPDSSRFAHCLV